MRVFTRTFLTFILSILVSSSFAASLSGVITDDVSEQPIADVLVWAFPDDINSDVDSTVFYEVISNENGHYYFDLLPAGKFTVTAHHPDYYDAHTEIESVDGEIAILHDFKLTSKKHHYNNSISGQIRDNVNGFPLPNVHVVLYASTERPHRLTAISDRDGNYMFKNIHQGSYKMMAFKRGYETFALDSALNVRHNIHIKNIDFAMIRSTNDSPGRLSGFVFADDGLVHVIDSVDGIRDMFITPAVVYPALIEMYRITDDIATYYHRTWTNPDGSYRIRGITPGDFIIVVRARGYIGQREHITIHAGHNEKIFFLKPRANHYGLIGGNVSFDRSNEPVGGALINFINLDNRGQFHHTYTNRDGQYKARLKPGRYVVSCSYMGFNVLDTISVSDTLSLFRPINCGFYMEYYDDTHSFADAERIAVYRGSQTMDIDFGLPDYLAIERYTVSGSVLDEDGSPIAGAKVRVYINNCYNRYSLYRNSVSIHDRLYSTMSGNDGSYSITIENGLWYTPFIIVSAHKEGFLPQFYDHKEAFYEADRIRVNRPEINEINFDLIAEPQNNFSMAGRITDSNNNPIPATFVITGNVNNGQLYFAFSNNQGDYTFSGLPAGVYYTLFMAFGYGPELWDDATHWADADPIMLDQDLFDINAVLQPVMPDSGDGTITGRIRNQRGAHVSGALVTVRNNSDQIVGYSFSDVNGDYTIAGLSSGEFSIEAGKVAFNAATAQVFVTSGESATVVADIDIEDYTVTSLETEGGMIVPEDIFLSNNYPNPFNPSTTVNFGLNNTANVRLSVFNILGQRVNVLINSTLPAGNYKAVWNGLNSNGQSVGSGIYLLILETGNQRLLQKMILTR